MKIAMSLALLACLTLSACPQEESTDTQNTTVTHTETEVVKNTTTETKPGTDTTVVKVEEEHHNTTTEHKDTETHADHSAHKVYFTSPANGDKVKSPVKVQMGIEGMSVKAAGEITEGTGHHHLIIDGQAIPKDTVVPKDDTHMHFGKGQTETEVELKPGKHTLTLQFADGAHRSYGPEMSTTIDIEVVE